MRRALVVVTGTMATRSKVTKTDKKKKMTARESEATKVARFVEEAIAGLSTSQDAANIVGGVIENGLHGLMHDRPLVEAAGAMWKKAAAKHALTGVLGELAAELARHEQALEGLVKRCEVIIEADNVEIEADDDDKSAIEDAVVSDHEHDH
jgi:hypothetical protein